MVKFRLPRHAISHRQTKGYRSGNHPRSLEGVLYIRCVLMPKILIEFDSVKFDENSRRIRVDFSQKHRFKANGSFKPLCYGLVQRRWNSRRG
jgi:hypothetical protein